MSATHPFIGNREPQENAEIPELEQGSTDPFVGRAEETGEVETQPATTAQELSGPGLVAPEISAFWLLLLLPLLVPFVFLFRGKHRHLLNHNIRNSNRFRIEDSRFRQKVVPEFVRHPEPLPNDEFDELSFEESGEEHQDTVVMGASDSSILENEIESLRNQFEEARDQMTHLSELLESAKKREVPFR